MAKRYRKCKICKTRLEVSQGMINGLDFVCGIDHLVELGVMRANKAKEAKAKAKRVENRAKAKALKPIAKLRNEAQAAVNAWIRWRDRKENCISCGRDEEQVTANGAWVGGCWDAGHFRSRGAANHLRFNLLNIHKQCKACNQGATFSQHRGETVTANFEHNVRLKIGNEAVDKIKNDNTIRSFDREYLERVKTIFRKRLRLAQRREARNETT